MYVKFFYGRVLITSSDRTLDSFVDGNAIYTEPNTTSKDVPAAKVFSQNILPVYHGVKFFSFRSALQGVIAGKRKNFHGLTR
jgi:hypothetical protein